MVVTVYYFRAVETDASGAYQRTLAAYPYLPNCEVTSSTTWIWEGTQDSNWNNRFNWDKNSVPDATSDVIIQKVANQCNVNITGALSNSVLIQPGATLTLTALKPFPKVYSLITQATFTLTALKPFPNVYSSITQATLTFEA